MKKITSTIQILLCSAVMSALLITACNSNSSTETKNGDAVADSNTQSKTNPKGIASGSIAVSDTTGIAFNINDIPVTTKDIGTFPYLKAPEGYKYNDISKSDLATVHFAVNGALLPVEGKTYSTNIYKIKESEASFNMLIVGREYDKAIKELGGVQVSAKLLPGQVEKIGKKLLEDEGDHAYTIIGANDYTLNHVNTYVIKTEKAQVWIELSFYQNGGYIYILQKEN